MRFLHSFLMNSCSKLRIIKPKKNKLIEMERKLTMKKLTKRILASILASIVLMSSILLVGCAKKETVIIYTSAENFQIDYMRQRLQEKFPDYDIRIDYRSSGDQASLMKAAGTNVECHITHNLEYGNAAELAALGVFADLSDIVDFSKYTEDAAPSTYYAPELRNGGAVILNMDVITERGLKVPTSYEDLLDPQYKGLISISNPKTSGTGYMFLLSLVNVWGEEKALNYFAALKENVLAFETSGSGPVNKLITKEVAVGFGMISHAVQQINEGENLKIVFFDEGAPYSLYGQAIIKGNETKPAVKEVFEFLANEITQEKCERFYPEKIFKDKDFTLENFPSNIDYSDMSNNTPERKTQLLGKWTLS